eukprot:6347772-Prymnesium_polylepis.1
MADDVARGEHVAVDDSTSGGITVASATDHLHENDHDLGTVPSRNSTQCTVQEEIGARRRTRQLE